MMETENILWNVTTFLADIKAWHVHNYDVRTSVPNSKAGVESRQNVAYIDMFFSNSLFHRFINQGGL